MRRRSFLALVGSVGVGGCLRSQTGTDTEQFTTDGQRTAETPTETSTPTETERATTDRSTDTETETEVGLTFAEQWSAPGSEFTVADGAVYTNNGMELAAWAVDGERQWRREVDDINANNDPVVTDGTLYAGFGFEDGAVRAFDATDGTHRWTGSVNGIVRSDVLPAGDAVLVNVRDLDGEEDNDAIVALDRTTGELRWTQESGLISVGGSKALGTVDGDGFAYVTAGTTFNSARVSKLDPSTGERVWDWTQPTPASEPVYADGNVYLGTYDSVIALASASGEERWRVETFDQNRARPVVDGDTVYAGSNDTGVYAIGVNSGEQRWRFQTDGSVRALAVGDQFVYAGTDEGTVFAIDESGERAGQITYEDRVSGVTCADETLLISTTETVAYRVSEP